MKRVFLASILALFPLCAMAQRVSLNAQLTDFASRSLAKCPEEKISVVPVGQIGPRGFNIYNLTQESADSSCQRKTYLLHSPISGQILIGTIFTLEQDARPVTMRIADVAGAALKQPVVATVAPFPMPDGVRSVSIATQAKSVGFTYHGFLDASNNYLIVGTRGNLNTD